MTGDNKNTKDRISMQEKVKIVQQPQITDREKGLEDNLHQGREFLLLDSASKENFSGVISLNRKDDSDSTTPATGSPNNDNELADFINEITVPPRGKKQGRCKTTIEWNPDDYEKLAKACSTTNLSMSEFIRKCVKRVLDKM
jgi:hypothetical protein